MVSLRVSAIFLGIKVSVQNFPWKSLATSFISGDNGFLEMRIRVFIWFKLFMQGDANSVQVSVQLKLSNKVKNSFEYCEVHLPFFHRFVLMIVSS